MKQVPTQEELQQSSADACSIQCSPGETIGQMVAKDMRKAAVFTKYGIDFCCGGKKTLRQVCYEKGLDHSVISKELDEAGGLLNWPIMTYDQWPLDFLADYIVNVHHSYTRKKLPELLIYAAKVTGKHGPMHPELVAIRNLIVEINEELSTHLLKEEHVLFPFIRQLADAKSNVKEFSFSPDTIANPVQRMLHEHEQTGSMLASIRRLTNDFVPPADACMTYKVFFKALAEFEADLHIHIHLENNILFPGAISLVNEWQQKYKIL